MDLGESLKKNWSNIVGYGCIIAVAIIEAWQQASSGLPSTSTVPRLGGWWQFAPAALLILGFSVLGARKLLGRTPKPDVPLTVQTPPALAPGMPTLSALLGQNTKVEFSAKQFFASAHYSPITAEVEKNMRVVAQEYSPSDKEAFYARFLGVGIVAYFHDLTWYTIYGSQLAALEELNSRGLISVGDLKKHYDKGVTNCPAVYKNYPFEKWVDYMKDRMLIAVYPTRMVELSFNGKDFLKYLAHVGRNIHAKAC